MLTRQELLQNPDLYRDKARGALIGLAIGDSFGDASRKPENQMAYGFTTDFNKGASWSTDDTEFAMLTAQILIESGGRPTSDCVVDAWLKHVATQDELKRGGASEFEASRNLRKGLRPPLSGRYNAYGHSDGAAMRISPVGVLCAGDVDRAIAMAEIDASISHDREGIWGAQSVAAAVAAAMADANIDEILAAGHEAHPQRYVVCLCHAARAGHCGRGGRESAACLDAPARRAVDQLQGRRERGRGRGVWRAEADAWRFSHGCDLRRQFRARRGHHRRHLRRHSGRQIWLPHHPACLGGKNPATPPAPAFCLPRAWISARLPTG